MEDVNQEARFPIRAVARARARAQGTFLALALVLGLALPLEAQRFTMQTTPERTNYEQTSTYDDVMNFLRAVDRASPLITLDSMGKSFEGRTMPLVIVGKNLRATTAEAIRASGKLRIYLQGNIHAGEVEGKESLQILLREIANGEHGLWLDSMVLLINPIYNLDGNEKFGLRNRGRQHGPLKGMGTRAQAQDYNLNRDYMKLDSPEGQASARMQVLYDPYVGVDLHTTDGTTHGYFLTYSPPLHPTTPASIISLLRDRLFPELTRNVKQRHGWDYYYYGNANLRDTLNRSWSTFEHVPRFNNNYYGVRNRIGILSEAYSYATFEDRIKATNYFVNGVLDYAYRHNTELKRIVEEADRTSIVGKSLATRAAIDRTNGKKVTILLGEVDREVNPYSGDTIWRRKDVQKPVEMTEYGTFAATETEVAPRAYFVPPQWAERVSKLLVQHGVKMRNLRQDSSISGQQFRIDSTTVGRVFEKHPMRTAFGKYEDATIKLPAGSLVIDVNQPLGLLAFLLLEPRSDDGLLNWNVFDPEIEKAQYYPVVRALK
jgi:Zinc carboxypeptidase